MAAVSSHEWIGLFDDDQPGFAEEGQGVELAAN
jgi:hypothetical protein